MATTVRHNQTQNGIEVVFPARPTDTQISWLKGNGFKYSSRNGLWYKTFNQSLFDKTNVYFEANNQPQNEEKSIVVDAAKKERLRTMMSDSWILENRQNYDILKKGLDAFMRDGADYNTIIFGKNIYQYNSSKKSYEHTPKGRKRPDFYSFKSIYSKILYSALENCLTVPIHNWLSVYYGTLENERGKISTLESHVKLYPQQANAEDYQMYFEKFSKEKENEDAQQELWNKWKEKHLKVGQTVYVKSEKGHYDAYKVREITGFSSYYHPKSVSLERNMGYIIWVADYYPENLFLTNPSEDKNAQNLIQAYGMPSMGDNTDADKAKKRKRMKMAAAAAASALINF